MAKTAREMTDAELGVKLRDIRPSWSDLSCWTVYARKVRAIFDGEQNGEAENDKKASA